MLCMSKRSVRKLSLVSLASISIRIVGGERPLSLLSIHVLLSLLLAKRHVHSRGCRKAKGLADRLKVELVHIKDISLRMTGIGQQVAAIGISGGPVQVVVGLDQTLQLRLNVGDLVGREFVFVESHLGGFQILEKTSFFGCQQEQGSTGSGGSASGSTHAVAAVYRIAVKKERQ
jgi:hypothetical protein